MLESPAGLLGAPVFSFHGCWTDQRLLGGFRGLGTGPGHGGRGTTWAAPLQQGQTQPTRRGESSVPASEGTQAVTFLRQLPALAGPGSLPPPERPLTPASSALQLEHSDTRWPAPPATAMEADSVSSARS